MNKFHFSNAAPMISLLLIVISAACTTVPESQTKTASLDKPRPLETFKGIRPGLYDGGERGPIRISKDEMSYLGTYGKNGSGLIVLWREGDSWKGMWEEQETGRAGLLYDISISKNGAEISGLFSTSKAGEKNSFSDRPFVWQLIE